jgi:HK97 gp10 family phage protein
MIAAAVAKTVDEIADDARSRAPVDTGRLRDSTEGVPMGSAGAVIAGAFYSHLVEFGSASTPARPFMVPAAEAGRARFVANATVAIRLAAAAG